MGLFSKAKNELQYLMVTIDNLSKWVEANALRTITEEDAIKFLNDSIVTRFKISRVMMSYNGNQFVWSNFVKCLIQE